MTTKFRLAILRLWVPFSFDCLDAIVVLTYNIFIFMFYVLFSVMLLEV